ncbi:MAG TPA: formate dehydrogenase accessory sulfurtransferase FdhD [Polyangiales bacterium]|nr:formate dehydrogenase accessory sulfurtransferase FdhD [Polyangiales bacterium]
MSSPLRTVHGLVVSDGRAEREPETVLVEAPLAIQVAGDLVATTMRTPGEDRFLALGFLFAEGVVHALADVGSVYHCGRTDQPGYGDTIEVVPAPGVKLDVQRSRREGWTSSACGICGRAMIDDLRADLERPRAPTVPASLLRQVPRLLQLPLFAETGGAHGACAITRVGEVLAHAEDVGRHNAVDKVIGKLLYARRMPDPTREDAPILLAVSARAGFEIVQKAARAGFACVATVSAPSSLAIDAAEAAGLTLASFVRDGRFTLYSHATRIEETR